MLLALALPPVDHVTLAAVLEGQREVKGAAPLVRAAPVGAQLRRRRLPQQHVAHVDQLRRREGRGGRVTFIHFSPCATAITLLFVNDFHVLNNEIADLTRLKIIFDIGPCERNVEGSRRMFNVNPPR